MVKMKRLFLLCAFVSMFATCNFISAQKELGIFNSVSAGVGVGLTGVDVEVATPITPYLALREVVLPLCRVSALIRTWM